ncbi:hypothetical protein PR002_g25770 [Phytophthora rubi]|uniref:Uncharacterized protein n=1 Tax=Phytophthora rubi TaxID=129364 RepID=A0A6A3I3Y9_9STRA|nr:hypothetical protein PR002_g25770 [Phytophthora rubi]
MIALQESRLIRSASCRAACLSWTACMSTPRALAGIEALLLRFCPLAPTPSLSLCPKAGRVPWLKSPSP